MAGQTHTVKAQSLPRTEYVCVIMFRSLLDEESAQEQRGRLMLRQQPRAPFLQVQGQSGQQAELVVPMRCAVLPLDDACDIYARTEQNVP